MTKNIAVSEELYAGAAEWAEKGHVSVEEFVSSVLAGKLSGRQYIEDRARRASRDLFLKALEQVPDVEPELYDHGLDGPTGKQSIATMVLEIWRGLPDDARAKLPADGAGKVDHYVYGIGRRDQ